MFLLRRIEADERVRSLTADLHGPVLESLAGYIRDQAIELVIMTTHLRGA